MSEKFVPLYWNTRDFGTLEIEWEKVKTKLDEIAPQRTVLNMAAELDDSDRDENGESRSGFIWLARKMAVVAAIDPDKLTPGDALNLILKLGQVKIIGWSHDLSDDFRLGGYVLKPDEDEKYKDKKW